jgi:hypothetical protein
MSLTLEIHPSAVGAIHEACVALGGHPLQRLLARITDRTLHVTDEEMTILRDYLDRIAEHLDRAYPRHDAHDPLFDPAQEEAWLDALETMRHPLIYALDRATGGTFSP